MSAIVSMMNRQTYRVSDADAPHGHGIIHKSPLTLKWTAKVYCRGELFKDLGSFRLRREALDMTCYWLAFEVKQ